MLHSVNHWSAHDVTQKWVRTHRQPQFLLNVEYLPGEKRARFDQGSRNCLQKIVRQRDAILTSCWFARRQITITTQEVFEMTKQEETRRIMFTLPDQAIDKLNQLVAKKQQEVDQDPKLAKYHVKVTKSTILVDLLADQ